MRIKKRKGARNIKRRGEDELEGWRKGVIIGSDWIILPS